MRTTTQRRRRIVAAMAAVVALTTGCGTRLERREIISANTVLVKPESGAPTGTTAAPGTAEEHPVVSGSGSPTAATPSASPQGVPSAEAAPSATGTGSAPGAGATPGTSKTAAPGRGPGASPAPAPGRSTPPSPSGAGVGAGPQAPAESGPLVIGSVGNYSGPAGAAATGMPDAVKAWAAATNSRGGLLGRQIQVIVVDDGADPSRHLAALRDLVENRKAIAFVGNYAPLTAPAGRKYLEDKGVPVIGTGCTLEMESQSPVFFNQCPVIRDIYINVARNAARYGPASHKMALLYCAEAEICRYADSVLAGQGGAKQGGMEVVYRAQVSLVQPDYTSECLNARQAGAEVMFPLLDPNGFARLAQSCARQGYRPIFATAHNISADASGKTGLENVLVASPSFPFAAMTSPAAEEFYKAFGDYVGKAPGPAASQGWLSSKLFALAATKASTATRPVDAKSLVEALRTLQNETLDGLSVPLTFTSAKGSDVPPCWWAMQGNGSAGWKLLEGGKLICA